MTRIAIIGAGIAGLTAAYHLRQVADVTIYEKSRGVTGRAATRWVDRPDGRVYVDHGAQYLHDDSAALHELMIDILPRNTLTDIGLPVWTFDAAGTISEGDPARNADPKWSYTAGLASLGRLIVEAGSLNVQTQVRVVRLNWQENLFQLFDNEGKLVGEADQVLVAIPAGQAADLIAASDLPTDEHDSLTTALRRAIYRRCISVTLGFDHASVLSSRPYYALVNSDRGHAISWVGLEHFKQGHVPPAYRVAIVQMAGGYSEYHWETPIPDLTAEVMKMASALLGEDLTHPDWSDVQRWRYSQPDQTINGMTVNGLLPGLWFAGDYLTGGRVHLAAQNGKDIATVMHATL